MMRIAKAILIFHQKIFAPVLVLSVVLGLVGGHISGVPFAESLGISYTVLALLFHYFIYEVSNPNEYYFYYNLGLSKLSLWLATLALGILVSLFFTLL